jgi:citrate lyase subunit beta/citryl-CoA lyase
MRSLLFVPADGGAKLDKALASGADAVIIDLEDSIAPDRKGQARASAAAFLKMAVARPSRPRLFVRAQALLARGKG